MRARSALWLPWAAAGSLLVSVAWPALIPPFFLDCVVSIGYRRLLEEKASDGSTKLKHEFVPMASGFLYGDFVKKVAETKIEYRVYLVTNRHVLEGIEKLEKAQREQFSGRATIGGSPVAYLRFNPRGTGKAREDFAFPLRKTDGTLAWLHHKEVDVAVVPIAPDVLEGAGMQFNVFGSDAHIADRAKALEVGLTEGDGVYALGFPMGLVGGERNFVIARQGSIARIRDFLAGSSKEFLVDMLIFPGNSGGPVVTRTEFNAIQGTKRQDRSYLIGVVRGYIPYRDVAVSRQTGLERVTFEENSGLAAVIPMDFVMEVIDEHRKSLTK